MNQTVNSSRREYRGKTLPSNRGESREIYRGEPVLVEENRGEQRELSRNMRESYIKSEVKGNAYEVERNRTGHKDVNERYEHLADVEHYPEVKYFTVEKDVTVKREEVEFIEREVEKVIEIIIEKPVPYYTEKEVFVDI